MPPASLTQDCSDYVRYVWVPHEFWIAFAITVRNIITVWGCTGAVRDFEQHGELHHVRVCSLSTRSCSPLVCVARPHRGVPVSSVPLSCVAHLHGGVQVSSVRLSLCELTGSLAVIGRIVFWISLSGSSLSACRNETRLQRLL